MRDPRVDALAQILVRYSTHVGEGDVCVIQSTTAAEPLVEAVYEEVLRAGGRPILQLSTDGRPVGALQPRERRPARLDPADLGVGRRERRRAHRDHGRGQHARAVADRPEEAGARLARPPGPDGDLDAPLRRRRVPLGADALPDARLRQRGRHVAARLRGLLLRGLPRHRRRARHRLAAPVGRGDAARRVDRGQGGGAGHRGRHRHHARRVRPPLDPLRRRAQHARRRVLHRPGRGLCQRRDLLLVPGLIRRPDRLRRPPALRGRQGGGRLGRGGRGLPDRDARHRRGRAPPRARSASARTTASRPAPRRSCSTRRSAGPCTWRSA